MTFKPASSYVKKDLVACANGDLFGPNNGRLPADEMLMFDAIDKIDKTSGRASFSRASSSSDVIKGINSDSPPRSSNDILSILLNIILIKYLFSHFVISDKHLNMNRA